MPFEPQLVMHGHGQFFESAARGGALSGVHPGLFQPPVSSPASHSSYMGKSTGSGYSNNSTPIHKVKRKRHGPKGVTPPGDWAMATSDAGLSNDGVRTDRSEGGQLTGEGEKQYVLAGQMETPNGVAPRDITTAMEDSIYSDVDYRRALGSKRNRSDMDMNNTAPSPTRSQQNGWGSFAINTIGGVVGKVFQFCKSGVFRGFYAGGGKGYDIRTSQRPQSSSSGQVWCNEHDIPTLPDLGPRMTPGAFPQSDPSPTPYERGTPESTPPPAAKRRQITDKDELRINWVMVQEPADSLKPRPQSMASQASLGRTTPQGYPSITRRRINRPISRINSPSLGRRQSTRLSHAGSSVSQRESASFASPRVQSPALPPTPSRIPIPSRPQTPDRTSPVRLSQQPSFIPSPSVHQKRSHRRNHSTASAASGRVNRRDSVQEFEDNSPRLDAEAKNLAAIRIQEEMETDIRMNDFNARLRDMIRQGKEALGTTIEVESYGNSGDVDPWEDD
ncbi:uncharacterized protein F4822DRAFT_101137 [Hypoxylon trugodes]|uniref:uncharacterized protein n=1 Tax=Hypoxylon trugodes TaxID=326681 RepID=UPI002197A1AE|nr:uncharacterized protein F4822DRAFT_101137 [Hypoxylon trugodes]KAI1382621.1 hypothetical protein F4822DRAFT_101137 [Hypoxylon trugodes]